MSTSDSRCELDEILKLSTRILVIYNGEIVGSFDQVEKLSGADLGPYMLGIKKQETAGGKIHS